MDRMLLDWLPPVLRDVREYKAIFGAQQPETDELWALLDNALDDQSLSTMTTFGVARWEAVLGLSPANTDTLELRRFAVAARLCERAPYTMRTLRLQLSAWCGGGFEVRMAPGSFEIFVIVHPDIKGSIREIEKWLRRILPANMALRLSLKYNEHGRFAGATYGWMAGFTHHQLRNEENLDG